MIRELLCAAVIIGGSTFITAVTDSTDAPTLYARLSAPEAPALSEVIEAARVKYGLPKGLIEGVIYQESRFDEFAKNPEKALCQRKSWPSDHCESRGLMGVVYGFHHARCNLASPDDLFDYRIGVDCGARVLRHKLDVVPQFRKTRNGQTNIVRAQPDLHVGVGLYNGDVSGKYSRAVLRHARKFTT